MAKARRTFLRRPSIVPHGGSLLVRHLRHKPHCLRSSPRIRAPHRTWIHVDIRYVTKQQLDAPDLNTQRTLPYLAHPMTHGPLNDAVIGTIELVASHEFPELNPEDASVWELLVSDPRCRAEPESRLWDEETSVEVRANNGRLMEELEYRYRWWVRCHG
jgi:hypothetical protein